MTHDAPRLLACGDTAFTIEFGDRIDPALSARVRALDAALAERPPPGLVETVPTYRSLTVHLDPLIADPEATGRAVLALAGATQASAAPERLWHIPVVYGGAFGIDLAAVADHHGLSPGAVIERHAAPEYRVAMIGFLPGYAYLEGLDPALALSRRPHPRPSTPAGTISIGGAQALVASIAAPSGWHLLGRTPVKSFLPGRDPVFLLRPGDRLRFVPIAAGQWDALAAAAKAGETVVELREG
ncbi:5-oxoprolinase subunit PxpB [Methylobacterium sp. Leaf118]|uniref:5-oxoprolinase subunit PxpB n=1 Tax=Methylobacterium sp. Leaf118 TaxID=2876562 RepID=UPI001E56C59A|nr:5-oxoprolinase subunit PxpB [Methylobacterium sp. Leaf118]